MGLGDGVLEASVNLGLVKPFTRLRDESHGDGVVSIALHAERRDFLVLVRGTVATALLTLLECCHQSSAARAGLCHTDGEPVITLIDLVARHDQMLPSCLRILRPFVLKGQMRQRQAPRSSDPVREHPQLEKRRSAPPALPAGSVAEVPDVVILLG